MTGLRKVTLSVIADKEKILLGLKKRGFGKGLWNGFGGKPSPHESLIDCLYRETKEEAGILLPKQELNLVAILDFYFTNKPKDWDQQVWVFKADHYEGTPTETDEMRPQEFSLNEIPYDDMWVDDKYWLPQVLDGKKVRGSFTFDEDGSILKKEIVQVALLEYM